MPALNALATAAFDASQTYAERVHIIHLYVVEPHPMAPDVSPYGGAIWEAEYSSKAQANSYAERVALATETEALLADGQLLLVDDLTAHGPNNPAWCTYGPCPNCAYLIAQDGLVAAVQTWLDADAMRAAIDGL